MLSSDGALCLALPSFEASGPNAPNCAHKPPLPRWEGSWKQASVVERGHPCEPPFRRIKYPGGRDPYPDDMHVRQMRPPAYR